MSAASKIQVKNAYFDIGKNNIEWHNSGHIERYIIRYYSNNCWNTMYYPVLSQAFQFLRAQKASYFDQTFYVGKITFERGMCYNYIMHKYTIAAAFTFQHMLDNIGNYVKVTRINTRSNKEEN
jgi:hypothetical protein